MVNRNRDAQETYWTCMLYWYLLCVSIRSHFAKALSKKEIRLKVPQRLFTDIFGIPQKQRMDNVILSFPRVPTFSCRQQARQKEGNGSKNVAFSSSKTQSLRGKEQKICAPGALAWWQNCKLADSTCVSKKLGNHEGTRHSSWVIITPMHLCWHEASLET